MSSANHLPATEKYLCSRGVFRSRALIDAATLLRKQFELLARLNELHAAGTIDHLLKKNPQFSALKTNIRRLYGEYSKIAHSAAPQPLELLGRIEDGKRAWTAVYPIFLEDAYVAL